MNAVKVTRTQVVVQETIEVNPIYEIGRKEAMKVVDEFLSNYRNPFIVGEDRVKWVGERLERIRQRYFVPI